MSNFSARDCFIGLSFQYRIIPREAIKTWKKGKGVPKVMGNSTVTVCSRALLSEEQKTPDKCFMFLYRDNPIHKFCSG